MKEEVRNMELEELFRSKLENAEIVPDITVRQRIMKKLAVREFLHFNPARFNIYYMAGIATAGVVAAFLLLSRPDVTKTEKSVSPGIRNEIMPDSVSASDTPVSYRNTDNKEYDKPEEQCISDRKEKMELVIPAKEPAEIVTPANDSVRKMEAAASISEKTVNVTLRKYTSASFKASVLEGCMPLRVRFTNTSVSYDSCRWIFGDGGNSTQVSPEWIYDRPGTYRVTLNVYSYDAVSSSSSAVITVFPKPSAHFEIQPLNPGSNDDIMQFINYSNDAIRYRWELGDGTVSTNFEPVHTYDKSGRYNIKLTVWSEHGCIDSAMVVNALGGSGYYIRFPNAFIPNREGPTGGYYSATSDAEAHIFHPEANGVTDYQLRIFSRTGILIFESNDINIGWDGYHKGSLCEPGVYIWKVRGTYKNGESFVKMGDLTLLKGN
ncbi:MAG: PKD domain-containing protein [Bacteroidales bacterium]